MSSTMKHRATALMILSVSSSLASPMIGRPSFGRVARNLLPFRCDVVPGDHAGLVDGINCEWDWWAHIASDFEPQSTDQWDRSPSAAPDNTTIGGKTPMLGAGCRQLELPEGPHAVACSFQNAADRDQVRQAALDVGDVVTERCSTGPFPITCIYTNDHDGPEGQSQPSVRKRTEHEWEHFDTLKDKVEYMDEHPELALMGCKHAFGDEWCYFESQDTVGSNTQARRSDKVSKRSRQRIQHGQQWTMAPELTGLDFSGLGMPSKEKRTFGCAQTHDSRCDFFDDGIIKHAICVFFNSNDKDQYISKHPDFEGRHALCNLVNSGPGLVCGFDLKGFRLPSISKPSFAAAQGPEDLDLITTTTALLVLPVPTSGSVSARDAGMQVRNMANYGSTFVVETIWPGTTSSTTTTTRKTMKTVIPDFTQTGISAVDVPQTSTSTSTVIMTTPYVDESTKTTTTWSTVFQSSPTPEATSTESPTSTSTTTVYKYYTPGSSATSVGETPCNHDSDTEAASCPVCSPESCLESQKVKECLQKNDDRLSHCDDHDDLCKCRAYGSRIECFSSCPVNEPSRKKAESRQGYYCTKAKALPPFVGNEKDAKKDGSDCENGATPKAIPISTAIIAAVSGAFGLLI